MRSKYYNFGSTPDWIQDTYQYPDILDIIEQEEKAKKARRRKRTTGYKPSRDRANIRARLGAGAFVSKEEAAYYRRTCTPFELAELERFCALHDCIGIASLFSSSDRGLNHGYSEGYTSTVLEMNGRSSLVMMPTATPDINIDEDSAEKVHTVLDVLQNNLHEDFGESLRFLAQTCPTDITEALGITDALSVEFEGCYVKRVESSWEQRLDDFKVDVIVSADFMLKVPAEHYCGDKTMLVYRDTRRTIDYRFRYTFDLYGVNGYKTCSGPITAPVQYFPEDRITAQSEWTTNRILRPNLTAKDFPILARKMLTDIYPEALETPTRLDGELLVKRLSRWLKKRYNRMNLRLRKEHLGKGDGVKGRIIFSDMEVLDGDGEPIKFKAGDIVVNLDEMRFDTDVLVTIVHECVHVYVDLPFFMLQLMAGKPHYSFIDRTSRWLKSERKRQGSDYQMELIEEMEKQDEKLTAYVMMEESVFRSECDRMFAMTGDDRTPPALMWMLENLSATFGASMQMTKIHMKGVGIPQAEGIWNFIGNRIRVPDHAVSGVWSNGIVYTIDTPDAIALTSSSQRFAQVLLSGKYIYLEGHYVLNRPKYVEAASDGTLSLTPYAHEHIEECCLAFRPRRRRKYYEYSCGAAARTKKEGNDKYKTVELVSEPGDADYDSENMSFSDHAQLWGELAGSLHGTFHDALQMVLDEIGVSQTTLASRMGVSRQAFQKWLKRDLMLKRHVVGICIALRLDMGVSLKLIELATLRLGCYGPDPIYLHLLCDRNMTVERGNDILVAQNYKKLNDGRQFEFDLLDFDPMIQEELRRKYGIADEK